MKHGRKRIFQQQEDGTVHIRTEGYYEELNSVKEELRQNLITTQDTLLKDIITALEVFTSTDCPEITIELFKDKYGEPQRMVKTWTVHKERK